MMALTAPSEYWNYVRPPDVNNDGQESTTDLLVLINSLTQSGPRRLIPSAPSASGGEGEGAAAGTSGERFYIDPNNDGMLNALDLLMVVNEMSAEGEDPPIIVRFSFVPVVHGTNTPLTTIPEGGHYELRVLVQDTGLLNFAGDTRDPTLTGVFSAFVDMAWDRSQTDVQINETQTIVLTGPTTATRFTLTFTDTFGISATTAPIVFAGNAFKEQTAANIRAALVALPNIPDSAIGNLPNIEVASSPANARTFTVRFINDLANKNFQNLTGAFTVAGGATDISITEVAAGDPTSLASFQEMFRPRPVLDANFEVINDDVNDKLYYDLFFSASGRPFATPNGNQVLFTGAALDPVAAASGGPRPLTQIVEVYRLRMTAKEAVGTGVVQFTGAYPDVSSGLDVSVLGDADDMGGPWTQALPAETVQHVTGSITIIELVSAVNDTATLNEGTAPGNLNSIAIDVLANDVDNVGVANLELLAPTLPPGFQGTVQSRTAGQDGINRPHFLYTVPNADFNGVVNFQYTIRDGAGPVATRPTDVGTVEVTVRAVNDAPVNSVPAGTQTVAEDAPAGLVFGGATAISISDVDAGAASVSIRLVATNGTLTMASLPGTLAIVGDGTNDLIIVGSIANINPALSGLKYAPNSNYNGPAQITVTTNDNGNSGEAPNNTPRNDVDVININVTATNDAPVNTVPAAVQVDESAQLSFVNGNTVSVADIDAGGASISVNLTTNSTQGGTLNLTGANVSGNNSQNVTVTGTIAAVNTTLATLKFNAGLPEIVTLVVLTNDNGNTGTPGPLTDTDNVEITVVATVRPRANPNTFPLNEGPASFDLNVLANDAANVGAQVTLESVGAPSSGSVTIIDAGVVGDKRDDILRFTPPSLDFFGQVTFTYSISETPVTVDTVLGANATATVTLNIANTPDVPVAVDDGTYAASEDVILNVNSALGVLANDSDADNLPPTVANFGLTAQLTQQPPAGQGSVNLAADGSFSWTPTAGANFFGTTSFKYRAFDPQNNQSGEATVTIEVASVNDAPVAASDGPGGIYLTNEDVPLVITLPGSVLTNDTDVETQNLLTAILVPNSATNGSVILNADGTFTFTPNQDFNSTLGVASFQYRAFDNDPIDPKSSNIATVTIQVNPVNDTPVAGNTEYTVEEGAVLEPTTAQGLRLAVTDPDQPGGFTGTIALVPGSGPAQGNLVLNADGSFTYTPPAVVVDPFDVSFRYTASDTQATSNEGTVTIHVIPFNDPPVAVADGPFSATEDQPLTVPAPGVLGNDSDEETPLAGLSAVLVSNVPVAAGSVALNADGSFTYTPTPNFFTLTTPISFTYQVSDGPAVSGGKVSNIVTVTINVAEVNDNPVANPDFADPVIRNFLNQLLPSALANDNAGVDAGAVPGDVLSLAPFGGPIPNQTTTVNGNIVRRIGNDLFFDDITGILGIDSFQYTISDGRGGTATATYSVNVVEFVPKDISGTVYVDADNDGVLDPGEKLIANATVRLNGTNVLGIPVFAELSTTTDELGRYSFDDLRPGNYTLTEVTPRFFRDGLEPATHPNTLVKSIADDRFTMSWDTPVSITTGPISGLNFGERGIDPNSLDDSAGLISEILASSGPSGMVLTVGPGNETYWSYCLAGWSTKATLQLEFGAGGTIPSLLLTIGGVTKRIYQDPANNTGAGSPQSPPAGSTARFRILGSTNSGEYIIRLDGTLSEFGFVAFSGAPPEAGEGESAPQMSDGQYRESADQVFADKAWA